MVGQKNSRCRVNYPEQQVTIDGLVYLIIMRMASIEGSWHGTIAVITSTKSIFGFGTTYCRHMDFEESIFGMAWQHKVRTG